MTNLKEEHLELLKEGIQSLKIPLNNTIIEQFTYYYDFLKFHIGLFNLTAIINPRDIILKHFLDSIAAYPVLIADNLLKPDYKVVDIGTGAGFPGIPLKIVEPNFPLTLSEVSEKKILFLFELIKKLQLTNVEVVNPSKQTIEKEYHIALTRAFGSLSKIYKTSRNYVHQGYLVAYKGKAEKVSEEIGNNPWTIHQLKVPYLREERTLAILKINHKAKVIRMKKEIKKNGEGYSHS